MSMKENKILGDDWLLAYAAGTLPFSHEMIVAAHLELNDRAQNNYDAVAETGGALFDGLAPADLNGETLNNILSEIDEQNAEEASAPNPIPQPEFLPKSLAAFFDANDIQINWKALGPGLKRFPIYQGENDERLWLLKGQPGVKIPEHSHTGNEFTLILKGGLEDGDTTFTRGDLELADGSVQHQPTVRKDEECICLVLTEGPVKFKGPIARAVQPFVGL
jgi:putative transcriptional regulator